MGMLHASRQEPADFADISMDFGLTYEEAIRFADGRISLTPEQFSRLSDDMRMHAFTIGRLSQLDMIEKVKAAYANQLRKGGLDAAAFIKEALEITGQAAGFGSYYDLVFRTNLQKDYNAGKAMQMLQDPPLFLEFVGIDDERQSDICAKRTGVILPYTDPWWDDNWPPLHYNCRSTIREIREDEAESLGLLSRDYRISGMLGRASAAEHPTAGFGRNPAKDNAFWSTTPSQQQRIISDLIQEEINSVAGRTICRDFQEDRDGFETIRFATGGIRYPASMKGDAEFQGNLSTARILAEQGGYYVELRENRSISGNRQWDAWLNGMDKVEFKAPEGTTRRSLENRILDGYSQAQSVAVHLASNAQIEPLKEMISRNMPRILKKRTVKQMIVLLDGRIALLSRADLEDSAAAARKLDDLL